MKNKNIIIIIIIAVCAGIAFYSLFSGRALTPYVSFKSAMESGDHVQIIGLPDKSMPFSQDGGAFSFELKESSVTLKGAGDSADLDGKDIPRLKITFKGAKPNNFENADQVVVQGFYDKEKNIFEAKKILVKCPSKYIKNK